MIPRRARDNSSDRPHAVVAGIDVLAEKLKDAEPHGRIGVEDSHELVAGDEADVDVGAAGGGAIVGASGHDVADAEDLALGGDAERLGEAVARGVDQVDLAGGQDVDAARFFAVAKEDSAGGAAL